MLNLFIAKDNEDVESHLLHSNNCMDLQVIAEDENSDRFLLA